MVNTNMSQCSYILNHLQKKKTITQDEARELYACNRLASRINNLRESGHEIDTIKVKGVNRFGKAVSWAKYKYIEPNFMDRL